MRLYDTVVREWTADPSALQDLQSAVNVDIGNVADYWDEHFRDGMFGDYSNARLPFNNLWLEFREKGTSTTVGVFLQDAGSDDIGIKVAGTFMVRGRDTFLAGTSGYRVDESGAVLPFQDIGDDTARIFTSPSSEFTEMFGPDSGLLYRWMDMAMLTIAFMHCKNVVLDDAPLKGSRQQRRALERKGVKQAKFKTLVIEPMKQVLKTEGGIETNGLKKALHICRGHFATYSEDRPLFGKYSGTFWKPAHVRGNADHGTVYKDYKVKAPRE